jgi:hypothetical protein
MRSFTSSEVESLSSSTTNQPDMIPLLPMAFDMIPVIENTSPSDTPIIFSSFTDILTTSLVGVFSLARQASQTISPLNMAEDSISGRADGTIKARNCIRTFQPVELSLFDVVLLANLVHLYAPIYSLFDNQCYLFASVIFDTVIQNFTLPPDDIPPPSTSSGSTPLPRPTPEVGAPNNANIIFVPRPNNDASSLFPPISAEEGRWSGLLIVDPIIKQTIVTVITAKFKSLQRTYIDEVVA